MNNTLKRATLTLGLLAASSVAFAAGTCPAADTAARAALDAQRRLQQIPSPQSADGDAGVLPAQRDAIRAY